MITSYFRTTADKKYKKSTAPRKGSVVVADNIDSDDLEVIAKLTGLSIPDIDDVLDENEIPRVEKVGPTLLLFLRVPTDNQANPTQTLACIIHSDFLLFLSRKPVTLINQIIQSNMPFPTTQKGKFLLHVLLVIANEYTTRIKRIRGRVLSQRQNLSNVSSKTIRDSIEVEETLNQYLAVLVPTKNVFTRLLTGKFLPLYEQDSELFEDVIISIEQSVDVCSVNLKSIRSLRDSYQMLFSNELNQTMKLLTSLTIILTIPTIMSSIYGMNVGLPFANSPLAFVYVLGLSALFATIAFFIFWWKRWF